MKIKFSILTFVIVLIGILSLTGCKTSEETEVYDIRGNWIIFVWEQIGGGFSFKITFAGSETSGTAVDTNPVVGNGTGTYTVNNTQVTFIMNHNISPMVWTYTGSFIDPDHITGTFQADSFSLPFDLRR